MNKILTIELKSNLCASSGTGLGSLIDLDICYDNYGLPYIPSKRIKGLLREAFLDYYDLTNDEKAKTTFEKLFGIVGNNNSGDLKIDNAYLDNIENIQNDIDNVDENYKKYLSKQRIINTNTQVRFQTAVDLETGISKDNSLRNIRVLNKDNKFKSYIECKTEEELELLKICSKLVTHMGMNRTRGFGEVKLQIEDLNEEVKKIDYSFEDEIEYNIKLLMKANSNIMVSKKRSMNSETFIPGSNIMGFIAMKYIMDNNITNFNNMDEKYINLFLNGKVKYSNGYITDNNGNLEFFKAPLSYTKVKNEENIYHNKMFDVKDENIQLSNLNDKYVTFDNYITSVKTQEQSHHQNSEDRSVGHVSKNKNGLYQFTSIDMGQYFLSNIKGKGKYLKQIIKYLKLNSILRVGKSKTAEYGKLTIKNIDIQEAKENKKEYKKFALILTSPLILFDEEEKKYANSKDELVKILKQELSINKDPSKSFIGYSEESGYNAIWNFPKEQLPSYDAGTTIVFELDNSIELNSDYTLGIRTSEGYGNIKVYNLDDKIDSHIELKPMTKKTNKIDISKLNSETKNILEKTIKQTIQEDIVKNSLEIAMNKNIKLNNSTIGRVLLMLEESSNMSEFMANVEAIKDAKKLEKVLKVIRENDITKLEAYKDYEKIFKMSESDIEKIKMNYVKELFLTLRIFGGGNNA